MFLISLVHFLNFIRYFLYIQILYNIVKFHLIAHYMTLTLLVYYEKEF